MQRQFTLFPLLPLELRLQIWNNAIEENLATSHPRIHRFATKQCAHQRPYNIPQETGYPKQPPQSAFTLFPSPAKPVPLFLHLCLESREVALEKYVLWPSGHVLWDPNYIFVNKEFDIFYFGPPPPFAKYEQSYEDFEILDVLDFPTPIANNVAPSFRYGRTAAQINATKGRKDSIISRIAGIQHWAFHKNIISENDFHAPGIYANERLAPTEIPTWIKSLVQNTDVKAIIIIQEMQFRNGDPEQKTWYLREYKTAMYRNSNIDVTWEDLDEVWLDFKTLVDQRIMYIYDKPEEEEIGWQWNFDERNEWYRKAPHSPRRG